MLPDVANYEEALALAVTDAEIEQASTHIHIHIHMNEEIEQACTYICTHTYERRGDRAGLPPRPASLSLTPLCVTHRPLLCVTCGSGTRPKVGLFGRALARSTGLEGQVAHTRQTTHATEHRSIWPRMRWRRPTRAASAACSPPASAGYGPLRAPYRNRYTLSTPVSHPLAACFSRLRTPP